MRHSVLCLFITTIAFARPYQDPSGFRVDLPEGWQPTFSKAGHIVIVSPDPRKYVYIRPLPNRTADCASTLRQTLTAPGRLQSPIYRSRPPGSARR